MTVAEVFLVFMQTLGENLFPLKNHLTVNRALAQTRYQELQVLVAAKYLYSVASIAKITKFTRGLGSL